ncbi:MAG: hypothetical protein KAI67_02245 [Candidatus Pacebacteria bacterium]|nr:hypothetical protein [Candidatus Paceibacterota bacterium]
MKKINFYKRILNEIKKKKEILYESFFVVVFIFVIVFFIYDEKQGGDEVFDYEKTLQTDLITYSAEIVKIKSKTERKIYSTQLEGMKNYGDLLIDNIKKEKKEDPFYKSY